MAKQVKQLSPLLTLFETRPTCYSLRLSEISKRATFLSIEVAKLLTDATSLEVITPTDMKVFDMTGQVTDESPEKNTPPFSPPPPERNEADRPEPYESNLNMDQVVEIAQAEEQKTNGEEKRFRQRKSRTGPVAGFDEPCQRCSGAGQIQVLMEGGHPATSTCPVCQGEKVVRRFGARRQ